ncbi:RNA polymerase factor sigma-54 [Altericroceibacterium xinjiangense]|uniref:RNA polymerase factor sigma-54 n=1 Tax=Altericroceibacterium xinjiangense TaxID=762261 RepID=UPI000F7D6557|nr:RNA polymerase factor sigma-54 [Altericroceibacterium xinjiangense]
MALAPRLDLRQTQSLAMTPQLQQAIKLLALSNLEIEGFIGEALEANPLLDAGESAAIAPPEPPLRRETGDWSAQPASAAPADATGDWLEIEDRSDGPTLAEHLEAQVGTLPLDAATGFVARYIIGLLDEAGYLSFPIDEIAADLGVSAKAAEEALRAVQSLDPTGVAARSLAECLSLQAKDADRHDPCMAKLIANLDLLAKASFAQLKRLCDVDDEDFADMLAELRSYDPKPGLRYGSAARETVAPDIVVSPTGGSGWRIALNEATLPRLVVNRSYYLELRSDCADRSAKAWLNERLSDANWLVKALDQRQKTILKVAGEVVKRQDGFFRFGVAHLKPLTLRTVAEAIGMHESTVSRATSNKYLQCERGMFELKYFFTSGVASADGESAASAEAVKAQIRALIEAEDPKQTLSDDTLVDLLRARGFDLARRTVAKYREAIGIGSSVQRRRQKKLEGAR